MAMKPTLCILATLLLLSPTALPAADAPLKVLPLPGEVLSVLALRQMKTSLWEVTTTSTIPCHFEAWRRRMLPDEVPAAK
jgi:hypothetical protein